MPAIDDQPVPDYLARLRLDGGYVVVGAGQGMGRQTAHALAQAGATRVLCVDIDPDRAHEVAEEIGVGVAWVGDVTKRVEVERLGRDAVAALGRVSGFVDIVGLAAWAGILELDDVMWDAQFDICLRHAYLVAQVLGRAMESTDGGTMVFIASVSGMSAAPSHAAYGAAKAGLIALVKSLAVELGPRHIRANAIAPGTIFTPRIAAMMDDAGVARSAEHAPLRRLGLTSDIGAAALFLSSELSSFITGQTLVVDGGVTVKFPYG